MPEADKNATDEILERREEVIVMPLPVFSPAGQAKYVASGVIALFKKKMPFLGSEAVRDALFGVHLVKY